MRRRSPGAVATVVTVCGLALTACSASSSTTSGDTYSFDPDQTAVDVNTPQLREQKAAAGIEPCPSSDPTSKPLDGGLPDVTLPCLGGGRDVRLAGLSGTPTVINFWAQTCGPCRTESPLFQQVHEAAGDRVSVIGINWQDPRPGYALAFADELGLTYPQVADPQAATRVPMRISALPITVFVDPSGRVTHTEYGAVDSASDLASLIHDNLGVTVDLGEGS